MKRAVPLRRGKPLGRTPWRRSSLPANPGRVVPLRRSVPVRTVSDKRRREMRERRAMAEALYPDRPLCAVPWCDRFADDLHEPLTRARGGSITDPENAAPLCRPHHDEITFRPESELDWAYDLGLLRHSWDAGGAA